MRRSSPRVVPRSPSRAGLILAVAAAVAVLAALAIGVTGAAAQAASAGDLIPRWTGPALGPAPGSAPGSAPASALIVVRGPGGSWPAEPGAVPVTTAVAAAGSAAGLVLGGLAGAHLARAASPESGGSIQGAAEALLPMALGAAAGSTILASAAAFHGGRPAPERTPQDAVVGALLGIVPGIAGLLVGDAFGPVAAVAGYALGQGVTTAVVATRPSLPWVRGP